MLKRNAYSRADGYEYQHDKRDACYQIVLPTRITGVTPSTYGAPEARRKIVADATARRIGRLSL